MKLLVSIFCFALIGALGTVGIHAQAKQKIAKTKPDFSGTWQLDTAKSNVGPSVTSDQPIKIIHHDPELRITHFLQINGQSTEKEFVYYSDGRGETNPRIMFFTTGTDLKKPGNDKDLTNSTTKWNGDKLVTRSSFRNIVRGRSLEIDVIDEWKLSKDGKTLTQTSRTVFRIEMSSDIFIPANRPDPKRIYNRVPD
jgi:hypothetical protein